jgi:hypothetical protein
MTAAAHGWLWSRRRILKTYVLPWVTSAQTHPSHFSFHLWAERSRTGITSEWTLRADFSFQASAIIISRRLALKNGRLVSCELLSSRVFICIFAGGSSLGWSVSGDYGILGPKRKYSGKSGIGVENIQRHESDNLRTWSLT